MRIGTAAFDDLFGEAGPKAGSLVMIRGAAASGKSTLLVQMFSDSIRCGVETTFVSQFPGASPLPLRKRMLSTSNMLELALAASGRQQCFVLVEDAHAFDGDMISVICGMRMIADALGCVIVFACQTHGHRDHFDPYVDAVIVVTRFVGGYERGIRLTLVKNRYGRTGMSNKMPWPVRSYRQMRALRG